MPSTFSILLELVKIRVTAAVGLTAAFGFLAARPQADWTVLAVLFGLFFQACGSAALNHWQERGSDALMERTRQRPLPAGRVSGSAVLASAILLLLLGSLLLWLYASALACAIGLSCFVWYNLVYTPLKSRSHLAVVPGSISGALPPMVGWAAAEGSWQDPLIWFIVLFLFIWQFPHFWIVLLLRGQEYEAAGLKTLAGRLSRDQLMRLSRNWVLLLALAGLCFAAPRFDFSPLLLVLLSLVTLVLLARSRSLMHRSRQEEQVRRLFLWVNAYTLSVLLLIVVSRWQQAREGLRGLQYF